jgi:hypothetical protein
MDPTENNLFELIKQNCTRQNCSLFIGYEKICPTYTECEILRNKLREWNLLFFQERPCNECLVRPSCIDRKLFIAEGYCEMFDQYWAKLKNKYNNAEELLYPELLCYYNLLLDPEDFSDDLSFIGAYYPEYINRTYTPKGILKF